MLQCAQLVSPHPDQLDQEISRYRGGACSKVALQLPRQRPAAVTDWRPGNIHSTNYMYHNSLCHSSNAVGGFGPVVARSEATRGEREPSVPREGMLTEGAGRPALLARKCGGAKPEPSAGWFRRSRCSRKREPLASDAPDPGSSNRSLLLNRTIHPHPQTPRHFSSTFSPSPGGQAYIMTHLHSPRASFAGIAFVPLGRRMWFHRLRRQRGSVRRKPRRP